jgi:hypothetical protein
MGLRDWAKAVLTAWAFIVLLPLLLLLVLFQIGEEGDIV